ncbi:CDP-glucose 4,6-dehydratase [Candidatus Methylospira mobilis]|uniref:CDP-glucose 4,6-dehydratase n=1 Tax=Candidatus Methylospira mobilis TaxID=1808979 RepID=UPI0028E917B7|nr:CDP-glucose 4,6-dehydratase [Candidatus Methylospira mobilis]WNV05410.1 CDP-glucose 4,6-dehydratase [Candidatus Methylospira mobilis]
MTNNNDFWAKKRIFITGHTGFKGSWLSLWLQKLGAEITGYALQPTTTPNLFETARVADGLKSIIADIRNGEQLTAAMQLAAPEIVVHMAAQPLVLHSYANPVETYSTNVMGTVHLFEAVRQTPSVRAVINVTSDKCYENREWAWSYRENEAMGGHDPYSSSKGCAELVTAAYRLSFFDPSRYGQHRVAIASARAGNVIGGGDWASDRLIPDMVRAISEKTPVVIRNPHAIRPWQHVLEPLSGYLLLAQRLYEAGSSHGEAWNFGPSDEDAKPVQWIVEKLAAHWGDGASWVLDTAEHPHEAHYLKLDCSKAKMRLNWHPRWRLAITLENIVSWHKAHRAGADMREFSLRQITDYSERT